MDRLRRREIAKVLDNGVDLRLEDRNSLAVAPELHPASAVQRRPTETAGERVEQRQRLAERLLQNGYGVHRLQGGGAVVEVDRRSVSDVLDLIA